MRIRLWVRGNFSFVFEMHNNLTEFVHLLPITRLVIVINIIIEENIVKKIKPETINAVTPCAHQIYNFTNDGNGRLKFFFLGHEGMGLQTQWNLTTSS